MMNTIANWDEVPIFDSEEAEALFWSENRPELRLMESAVARSAESAESVTISLRIDPRMLARIKRLAKARFLNYQSMMKQWLSERMEMEMNQDNPMKQQHRNRQAGAFTLIELLVVISIIGLLAGLVTAGAVIAIQKNKVTRVRNDLHQLETAIEAYKAKKGYYPPDNRNGDQTNALYYELAGAVLNAGTYTTIDGQDQISASTVSSYCGRAALANSSGGTKSDDNFTAEQFIKNFKAAQFKTTAGGVKLFNVPVEGGDKSDFNAWHYVSSHATNNAGGYDLWAEFLVGSKTNILGNWSDNPIVK